MEFEWDEEKNKENIRKHGIDFSDATIVFDGPMLTQFDFKENYNEDRWKGMGIMQNFIVVAHWTERDNGNKIRFISVRKALKYERKKFEKTIEN